MQEKTVIELINQVFELEKKTNNQGIDKLNRNFERIHFLLNEEGYEIINPLGEIYEETRTDCQATIINSSKKMVITEVIKPLIMKEITSGSKTIVQQARVII